MSSTPILRIAIADDEPDTLQFFQELLPRLGHEIAAVAETGKQLIERCRATHPDLVITDIKMPDMDGIRAAAEVNREGPVPVILITGHPSADILCGAGAEHVMACLSKPAKAIDLQAAITLAITRFAHFQHLRQESADLRQALDDRKTVERAKGTVMKRLRVDEQEAFRRMKRVASDRNRKLIHVADGVLSAEEIFQALEKC
jgi:AmiR/NasT family two-component response regulator